MDTHLVGRDGIEPPQSETCALQARGLANPAQSTHVLGALPCTGRIVTCLRDGTLFSVRESLVEMTGIEPATHYVQGSCSPS